MAAQINEKVVITAEDRTAQGVESVKKRFGELKNSFNTFAGLDFFGINARSIANFATAGFRSADALGAMAAQTGIAFNSISQLSVAADLADVPLEKLITSSIKLGGAIQDQIVGKTGPAQSAFARLGLSTSQLAAVQNDAVAQFRLVADALARVEDGSVKTALAADIFGAKGTEVLRLLNQGSQAFDDAAAAADRFNTNLNEIDVGLLGEADRQFTLLRQQMEATERLVAAKLAPTFIGFTALASQGLSDVAKEAGGATDSVVNLNAFIAAGLDVAQVVGRAFQGLFFIIDAGFGKVISVVVDLLADIVGIGETVIGTLASLFPSFQGAQAAIGKARDTLRDFADEEMQRVITRGEEFRELFTTPLTAGSIFFEAAEEAKRAAAEIKSATQTVQDAIPPATPETKPKKEERDREAEALERLRESLRDQVGALTESLATEEQQIQLSFERRSTLLSEALARDAITQEEYNAAQVAIERDYQLQKLAIVDEAANLRKGTLNDLVNFETLTFSQQVQTITSLGAQLLANLGTKNKLLFNAQKGFAIANAIINTYQGATNALATVPYPFNFAAAAAVVVAGLGQVAKIRATQPGSSGSGGGIGGGAAGGGGGGIGGGVTSPSTGILEGRNGPSQISITLQGNSYSRSDVIELIDQINGVVGDGVRLETGA